MESIKKNNPVEVKSNLPELPKWEAPLLKKGNWEDTKSGYWGGYPHESASYHT